MNLFVLAFIATGFLMGLVKLNLWHRDQGRRNTIAGARNAMALRSELNVW